MGNALKVRPIHTKWTICLALTLANFGLAIEGNVAAAGNYDGTYSGTQRVTVSNNSSDCNRHDNGHITLTVANNHFVMRWGAVLQIDVGADGSFDQSGLKPADSIIMEEIKGKITDGSLEADLGDKYCVLHLSLKKS
jgi:hypothetical protein